MAGCSLEEAFSKPNIHKPTKKINCNKSRSRFENFDNLEYNPIENFENYNPGEMFEYSEAANRIIPEDSNIEDIAESISDSETEVLNKLKPNTKSKKGKKKASNKQNNNLNPQINEINNKINFLIDKLDNNSHQTDHDITNVDNNIHDIILFILFGVFVIIILEGLFKLVNKISKHNILNNFD